MAKMTDKAVLATIAALEAELNDAATLAKAEPEAPPDESSDGVSSPPADDSGVGAAPSSTEAPPSATPEAPSATPEVPSATPEAPSATPDVAQDPAAQEAPLDPAALQAQYAQLPPDVLQMHLQAALAASKALTGATQAPPLAAPVAPPASPAAPVAKGEIDTDEKANGGLVKSDVTQLQEDLAALKKALAEKDEDVELLTKAVKMVIEKPERRALTGISQLQFLGKTEEVAPKQTFTRAEADAKITAILPSLTKAERDVVVQYSLGRVKIDALAGILEKAIK